MSHKTASLDDYKRLATLLDKKEDFGISADTDLPIIEQALAEKEGQEDTIAQLNAQIASLTSDKERLQAELDSQKSTTAETESDLNARITAMEQKFDSQMAAINQTIADHSAKMDAQAQQLTNAQASLATLGSAIEKRFSIQATVPTGITSDSDPEKGGKNAFNVQSAADDLINKSKTEK